MYFTPGTPSKSESCVTPRMIEHPVPVYMPTRSLLAQPIMSYGSGSRSGKIPTPHSSGQPIHRVTRGSSASSARVNGVNDYEKVWERFESERRLEFGGHRDPEWQGGGALSASLMVPVETSRFRKRLEPIRNDLRTLPYVSLHPEHFMHITLLLLGFLVPEPESENEVSSERLREISDRARKALEDFPRFSVEFANLNAFPGAAFVEAHDNGNLERIRELLCDRCGLERPPGPSHLTLAYFQAPDGTTAPEKLVSAIERYREWPVGDLEVDRVELTLLDVRSEFPRPETLQEIGLQHTG